MFIFLLVVSSTFIYHVEETLVGENIGEFGDSLQIRQSPPIVLPSEIAQWRI